MENIFFEIHKDIPREGPGNNAATALCYKMLGAVPQGPSILDVGCGPGMQTLELARISGGKVKAIDTHQPFLDALAASAAEASLSGSIEPGNTSMYELAFPPGSFDVIWAEGSIYILGFERALREWQSLLKPGGCLVASEVTWLKSSPPAELATFWHEEYPEMNGLDTNLRLIDASGYELIGTYVLPESGWWEYYGPLGARLDMLAKQYAGQAEAMSVIKAHQLEIDLFRQYGRYYGNVFYLMRRPV